MIEITKDAIVCEARTIVTESGLDAVTITALARKFACSRGSIHYHIGCIENLHRLLVNEAIEQRDIRVLSQALRGNPDIARSIPPHLAAQAARYLVQH